MIEQKERVRFGPYRLVRELSASPLGCRWLALRESDQSSHAVYRFEALPDRIWRRRHTGAMHVLAELQHPHLLALEMFSFDVGGEPWVVTPYTGNHDNIVLLRDVVQAKGESLSAAEAERAVLQVLEGIEYAHSVNVCNGPIAMEQLLVDRRGCVLIELYGVSRALAGQDGSDTELIRDEVRSAVEIAYRLVTGLSADEPRILAGRLAKKLPRAFEEWLEEGLHPGRGFQSAEEAISKLPHRRPDPEPSRVRTVLGRLKTWSR
jgi:serine/threonine protein kinase